MHAFMYSFKNINILYEENDFSCYELERGNGYNH